MHILTWIILSTGMISVIALIGVFTLSMKEKLLNKILLKLVALSSGALLGGAFLHLIPEGLEKMEAKMFFTIVLSAIILYLLIEKILHWRHCHKGKSCETHNTIGHMNLIGDSVHNFIDGLIIAAAFIVSIPLGLITVVAVALHEIPQEIGDFGVLIYSGFSKKKALLYNFFVALTVVFGGIVGYFLAHYSLVSETFFIPIAVGGFIYIATSDLFPELRKSASLKKFLSDFAFLIIGVSIMLLVSLLHLH